VEETGLTGSPGLLWRPWRKATPDFGRILAGFSVIGQLISRQETIFCLRFCVVGRAGLEPATNGL
jgi:hypothetical protein